MNISGNRAEQALRQRAYALADSGDFDSAHHIRTKLASEGWPNVQPTLSGAFMTERLGERIEAARTH